MKSFLPPEEFNRYGRSKKSHAKTLSRKGRAKTCKKLNVNGFDHLKVFLCDIFAPLRLCVRFCFLLLCVSTLSFVSCQKSAPSNKIRFVSLAWQEQAIQTNKAIVAEWNQNHPDMPVEYVQNNWSAIHDFLVTSFETGDVPDVFQYESTMIGDFGARGNLADLAPMISDDMEKDIVDGAWASVRGQHDEIFGVPFVLESLAVLYNKDLFDKAGITPPTTNQPWTWDDVRAAARKLTIDTNNDGVIDQYGVAIGLRSSANIILNLTLAFGGGYFHKENDRDIVRVGEPEKRLLATLMTMMYEDKTMSLAGVGQSGPSLLGGFYNGNYAIILGIGVWARQQVAENAPENFRWDVLPAIKAVTQQQGFNAQTLSIPRASQKQKEAMAFIEFFVNTENLTRLALADAMLPARTSCIVSPEFQTEENGWSTAITLLDHLTVGPWLNTPGFAEWKTRVANPIFQELFSNRLTIDEAAQRIEEESQRVLQRYQR